MRVWRKELENKIRKQNTSETRSTQSKTNANARKISKNVSWMLSVSRFCCVIDTSIVYCVYCRMQMSEHWLESQSPGHRFLSFSPSGGCKLCSQKQLSTWSTYKEPHGSQVFSCSSCFLNFTCMSGLTYSTVLWKMALLKTSDLIHFKFGTVWGSAFE